jgi:hypothetical protein
MKEIFDRRSLSTRNMLTERKASTIQRTPPTRTLPEIEFNSSTNSNRIWPMLTRKILNEDIHSNKDPNYLEFFDRFEIEAAYHSAEIEKTEKKNRAFELHKTRLREVNEDVAVEGKLTSIDTKLLESYLFVVSNLTKNRFDKLKENERPKSRNGLTATSAAAGAGFAKGLFLSNKKSLEQIEIQKEIDHKRRLKMINCNKQ